MVPSDFCRALARPWEQTWFNLMDHYRPCCEADRHPALNRRITRREHRAVRELARSAGLKNLL
ncbi:MAG: hypothetical protein R6W66_10440 [Pelovirga sp.]